MAKLAKLRQRVRRFRQVGKILNRLRSPSLDKALPSTSNAVERGNRRHRKMQKTVYRVRTQVHIHNRIALDMLRDSQKDDRTRTIKVLHKAKGKLKVSLLMLKTQKILTWCRFSPPNSTQLTLNIAANDAVPLRLVRKKDGGLGGRPPTY